MKKKIIKKVLVALKKESPVFLWNFLVEKFDKSKDKNKLVDELKEEFPSRAQDASRIVEQFLKNKSYEKFHKDVGPSILQRIFHSNLSEILDNLEITVKEKKN